MTIRRAGRSLIWSSGGPVSAAFRGWRCYVRAFPMCACRIWRIPARTPLVLAFRDEVARQVRSAEFSDLQGLIQGLSTGIQGELDKRDRRDERQSGQMTAGQVLPHSAAAGVLGRAGGAAGRAGCSAGRG